MSAVDERATFTRAAQVEQVLRSGGRVERDGGLLRLIDAQGKPVPAWQTAIKTAQKRVPPAAGAP